MFQQNLQHTPKLSGVNDMREMATEMKSTEERCIVIETLAQKEKGKK